MRRRAQQRGQSDRRGAGHRTWRSLYRRGAAEARRLSTTAGSGATHSVLFDAGTTTPAGGVAERRRSCRTISCSHRRVGPGTAADRLPAATDRRGRHLCRPARHAALRAHHLIAAAAEIPDRRAPHVHEPGEREHEEDRHAEEQVRLEDRVHVGDQRPASPRSSRMPCAQFMNFTISWPSRWPIETGMVARPSSSWANRISRMAMSPKEEVARMRASNSRRCVSSAMPIEAEDAGDAADPDRHQLLEAVADAERVEHPDRRQQADEVADEDARGCRRGTGSSPTSAGAGAAAGWSRSSRCTARVEAQQAAEQEHGQAR